MDAVTQYELWKAIWSSLNDGNLFELAHALGRHDEFLDTFVPLTFVGNHDVTRIASAINDERHLPHALVVAVHRGGHAVGLLRRRAGVPRGQGGPRRRRRRHPAAVPREPRPTSRRSGGTYRLHQELIGLRRRHPWLHRARHHDAAPDQHGVALRGPGGRQAAGHGAEPGRHAARARRAGRQRGGGGRGPARRDRGHGGAARLGRLVLTATRSVGGVAGAVLAVV